MSNSRQAIKDAQAVGRSESARNSTHQTATQKGDQGMTTKPVSNTKSLSFTENPWLFCQDGKHEDCAARVELTDRFELCPCLCHAPTTSAPASETGEWRYVETQHSAEIAINCNINNLRLRAHWTGLGDTETLRAVMRQVVSDRNAVLRLVKILDELDNYYSASGKLWDEARNLLLTLKKGRLKDAETRM